MATIEPPDATRISVQALEGFGTDTGISISMLRLDRMHPLISGNKWFKLRYNIEAALNAGKSSILSFGGAYSNHLIALAAAAHANGLSSIGLVRGEPVRNAVLEQCKAYGMQLHFISRAQYAAKEDTDFLSALEQRFPHALIVPEGGANEAGEQGAAEIAAYIAPHFSYVALSVGTGTTFAGLRRALPLAQQLMGFAPMKGGSYLAEGMKAKLQGLPESNWQLYDRFHFGGFGKTNEELSRFMDQFQQQYGFALDRVYTAKMMSGIRQLCVESAFPEGAGILCIHTGGLTGNGTTIR